VPKYFIRTADGTRGPFPGKEVQGLIEAGRLQPTDLIRQDGDRDWHPVSAVRGLRGSAPGVPSTDPSGGGAVAAVSETVPSSGGDLRADRAARANDRARSTTRSSSRMWMVVVVVALLVVAGMGWVIYRGSNAGMRQDADAFVQAILDGSAVDSSRARPYLDRLETSVRAVNEARLAEDADRFIDALLKMGEVSEGACSAMLARHKAGLATADQVSEFLKVLSQNPAVQTLSMGDKQWEQRLLKEKPKRLEALLAQLNDLGAPMKQLREIQYRDFDAKFERDRLAREEENKRLAAEARKSYEEMQARHESERLERLASSYNAKGTFTVAAQESGKVSFGREFLVPPQVRVWPSTQGAIIVHEAFYSQATIITEVTTTGFSWRCTLDLSDHKVRYNVPFNYCDLQWDATGPIRVSDLTPLERLP
jgi:hypothetical protein